MKTVFKVFIILVVAMVVGGFFYGVVTASSSGTDETRVAESPQIDGQFFPPDGEFSPPIRDEGESGIQFPIEAIKSLMIIAVVGTVYFNMTKFFNRKKATIIPM